ncbi:histidine kinase [Carnobacterium sp.]|uniref:sensor histidine kinase n=1 Tax=Carnobacterium sp. TaxID=48221 RepID=UPI0028ACF738|nr:histidine kinase [Carnobacterium sp.]
MKKLKDKYLKNELLFNIFLIVILSVTLVTVVVTTVVLNISEKAYVRSYRESNSIILKKAQADYEELNNSVFNILNQINQTATVENYLSPREMTPGEDSQTIRLMIEQLSDTALLYQDIPSNLILFGVNGKTFYQNEAVGTMDYDTFLLEKIFTDANKNPNLISYQFIEHGYTNYTKNSPGLVIVQVLKNSHHEVYGHALLFIREKDFAQFYDSLVDQSVNAIYVFDSKGTVISSNHKNTIGEKNNTLFDISQQILAATSTNTTSKNATVVPKRLYSYGYTLASVVNESALIKNMNLLTPTLLIVIGSILLISLLAYIIVKKTTNPIYQLIEKIPAVSLRDFDKKVEVTGTNEVKELAQVYNSMLEDLENSVEQLLKAQDEKRMAEIHALQMQIQPHFIYNTLASIKFLIWQGGKEKAAHSIDAFIKLLQSTIGMKDEFVTLEDELTSVKNYTTILQLRFGDNIHIDYYYGEALSTRFVPRMILQPIIENAFLHAFPEQTEGYINIFIQEKNTQLIIEIMDNGIGMDTNNIDLNYLEEKKKNHLSGIGLKNIDDRIKLLFGKSYGVTIISSKGNGTTIRIELPISNQSSSSNSD